MLRNLLQKSDVNKGSCLRFATFNSWSLCNKTSSVLELLFDISIDICCITETWLRLDDKAKFAEMRDFGTTYSVPHVKDEVEG